MREIFKQEMKDLADDLVRQGKEAARAMERSAESLRDANLALAEQVIDSDRRIDALERNLDEMGLSLLARQAPVAGDLRTVISVLRMSQTLERMGDLARHVAYVARGRYPESPSQGRLHEILVEMAERAAAVGARMVELLETHDIAIAEQIEDEDDILDQLHLETFKVLLDESNPMTRQEIIDGVLLGRYLERYGDHAVSVARRISFLVTGVFNDHDLTIREMRGEE